MIFQYFSRQISFSRPFQEGPLNSSTFQACANPVLSFGHSECSMIKENWYSEGVALPEKYTGSGQCCHPCIKLWGML